MSHVIAGSWPEMTPFATQKMVAAGEAGFNLHFGDEILAAHELAMAKPVRSSADPMIAGDRRMKLAASFFFVSSASKRGESIVCVRLRDGRMALLQTGEQETGALLSAFWSTHKSRAHRDRQGVARKKSRVVDSGLEALLAGHKTDFDAAGGVAALAGAMGAVALSPVRLFCALVSGGGALSMRAMAGLGLAVFFATCGLAGWAVVSDYNSKEMAKAAAMRDVAEKNEAAREAAKRMAAFLKALDDARLMAQGDLDAAVRAYMALVSAYPDQEEARIELSYLMAQKAAKDFDKRVEESRVGMVHVGGFAWVNAGNGGDGKILSFTIDNEMSHALKNLNVQCQLIGPLGTIIGEASETLQETVPANAEKLVRGFKILRVEGDVRRAQCEVLSFSEV